MDLPSAAEAAVLDALEPICEDLPGSERYVMVHHPAFRVGKKPFAIVGMMTDGHRGTVSINHGKEAQARFLADTRFEKTPYIGRHGWVTVPLDSLEEGELDALVEESWMRVARKKDLAGR